MIKTFIYTIACMAMLMSVANAATGDMNNDGKIGLEESIISLQVVSGASPAIIGSSQNLKNVITVAKANGDFTNPVDAINSIPTSGSDVPSFTNRYLIVIGPGMFFIGVQQIVMREWVSIQGAGQDATLITGAVSTTAQNSSSAIVVTADNSAISDLTINNTGGVTYSMGIYAAGGSPRIEQLTVTGSGSTYNYGIYIISSSPNITNVTATGTGYRGLNIINSSAYVRESTMEGTANGVIFDSNSNGLRIVNSKIIGGVSDGVGGTTNCFGNYSEALSPIDC